MQSSLQPARDIWYELTESAQELTASVLSLLCLLQAQRRADKVRADRKRTYPAPEEEDFDPDEVLDEEHEAAPPAKLQK